MLNEKYDDLIYLSKTESIRRDAQLTEMQAPVIRIEFFELPSWNDFLGKARHAEAAAGLVKKWRNKGKTKILQQAPAQGFELLEYTLTMPNESGKRLVSSRHRVFANPVFTSERPARLILRYWRPTFATYDTFSPFTKPVIDGFKDAGLFRDDNHFIIRESTVKFMGVDAALKLSDLAKHTRKARRAGTKQKSLPTPCRWYFDFYYF